MAKPNPWTAAKSRPVYLREGARGRGYHDPTADPVEPELKFFVLMLTQLGCYVTRAFIRDNQLDVFVLFTAPYGLALQLAAVDQFVLTIVGYTGVADAPYRPHCWQLAWNISPRDIKTRDLGFRIAARQMVRIFGPLIRAADHQTV